MYVLMATISAEIALLSCSLHTCMTSLVTPLNNRRYINYFIYLSIYVCVITDQIYPEQIND